MKTLSQIYIYPVKSLGGILVNEAEVTDRGLKYDRRWMLVDENHNFITQRKYPQMALIICEFGINSLEFKHKKTEQIFSIKLNESTDENIEVVIWDDKVNAKRVDKRADEWFSDALGLKCSLVYMPDNSNRFVDKKYAHKNELTNLSDGYPFLIIGQSSLDDLNLRLKEKLPMNRFRPNFVFTGGEPFEEDNMKMFSIAGIKYFGVKTSARCIITTINQDNAVKDEEPLRTLASYRNVNNRIIFGMNLLHEGRGIVRIGDEIKVIENN